MKIRFKDTDSQYDFLCMSDANAAIAIHMGMEAHNVIDFDVGEYKLVLVDKTGDIITVGEYDQWEALIYICERQYFDIISEEE